MSKLVCKGCEKEREVLHNQTCSSHAVVDITTVLLSCPTCDPDWEKTCGIDFRTYEWVKIKLEKEIKDGN